MDINAITARANKAAETSDHSVEQKGFTRELPPEGFTPARLISYVELGKHTQEFDGKKKNRADNMVRLVFELLGDQHKTEYEVDGEQRVRYNRITEEMPISQNAKAGFFKLFKKMQNGNDNIKHMAQMIGSGKFVIEVKHTVGKKDKTKKYVFLKHDGEFKIQSNFMTNPMTNEVMEIPVPEAHSDLQLLLWDHVDEQQWNSIYIDGTYTRKVGTGDDAKEVEVSKNFIQETCLKAENFAGSPLEALLAGLGTDMTITPEPKEESAPVTLEDTPDLPEPPKEEAPVTEGKPQEDTAKTSTTASPSEGDAAMAFLQGLQG